MVHTSFIYQQLRLILVFVLSMFTTELKDLYRTFHWQSAVDLQILALLGLPAPQGCDTRFIERRLQRKKTCV